MENNDFKKFKEVFPGIELDDDISEYFDNVEVTEVELIKSTMTMYVHMVSTHLIARQNIKKAEEAVRLFVFGEDDGRVVLVDRYLLSGQYNLENLVRIYGDSILDELREKSAVELALIKMADKKIKDNILTFEMVEGKMALERKADIEKFYNHLFASKFGMNVNTVVKLVKAESEPEEEEEEVVKEVGETPARVDVLKEMEKKLEEAYDADSNVVSITQDMIPKGSGESSANKKKDYKATAEEYRKKNYNDLDCFYGKNVEGDIVGISTIVEEVPNFVVIKGQVVSTEEKPIRNEKTILKAYITDFSDTIGIKLFVKNDDLDPIRDELKTGKFVMVKGVPTKDTYAKELLIDKVDGVKSIPDYRVARVDEAPEKRVELHLHTRFSEMDAVTPVEGAIQRALDWGHPAIAITDHGVVQGFTEAEHYLKSKDCTGDKDNFKILYGVEGYFVDDIKTLVMNSHGQSLDSEYVVFDIETTGLSFKFCKIIEIGAVRLDKAGNVIDRFSEFVNPEVPIPYSIEKLTSINDNMVKNSDTIDKVLPRFLEFCKGAMLVAHNATFDTTFIRVNAKKLGLEYDFTALDTMTLAYIFLPQLGKYNLDRLTHHFGLENKHHHRACDDAEVTSGIFIGLMKMINESGAKTVDDLNKMGKASPDAIKKAKSYHGMIFCKNETGRTNLYRLISEAHITYYGGIGMGQRPRIPMSLIEKYREGLIVGSACSSGLLYSAILDGAEDEELERIVRFFDYLEIQPVENNAYLIEDEKQEQINSFDDLREINKQIVALGDKYDKPVVATGDVHFLDPEDAIYRAIILDSVRIKRMSKNKRDELLEEVQRKIDAGIINIHDDPVKREMKEQPPLYFKTTDEMLEEFSYLGEEKAKEVVVTNSNLVASWIDKISPVRPDKAPPRIENSDQILRKICYDKMHEMYGPEPPEIVQKRLDKELDSIIGNGYSVMYIVAQKLVWKSNEDGYLVGSRGSVGSSFAATMAGITEVNPLPAHYLCPNCFYAEFDSDRVKAYAGECGCDMPDANCPKCGTKMKKEGHDIPFETFLGFKGDKEPDIDLNFSGEYQAKAHAYVGEIFGKDHSFKAGTVGTVADKTALAYTRDYCKYRGLEKRWQEMERLSKGCIDVKRTTGQHPGGIIVTPDDEEIYSFTPVQRPANDQTVDIITTHFEYHSIDHNLLKFDILGHDDPTMIRRLEDLTGINVKDVPFDDPNVMELFKSTEPLGITPEDMGGVPLGCLGVPEFGTEFAMQMLIDADPKSFSDLVRIAGLSHGTDVWLGNAQKLIQEGTCELSSAICCRDDIMVYLLNQGLDSGDAFTIMERVRKGIVAKGKCNEWPEFKKTMEEHEVPDWYIWSCEQIKYMFPKAHAVAYVMMSWRVAYFKIYYPLAYYAAYFSIRADDFSYEVMCQGEDHLDTVLEEYKAMDKNAMTASEKGLLKDMKIVKEMYARGFEFMPLDIYKAKADRFQIIDGKIMPSFLSIDKMGESAAIQMEEAAKGGRFLSQQELKDRAKISGTVIEKMESLGILGDMPRTSQLTFDFLTE